LIKTRGGSNAGVQRSRKPRVQQERAKVYEGITEMPEDD